MPVVGILENMSNLRCPHCGETIELFGSGGGERTAIEMNVPFLGRVPMDPAMVRGSDEGHPLVLHRRDSDAARAFIAIVDDILSLVREESGLIRKDVGEKRRKSR